jgi:serine/threonine-protein kinase
LTLGDAEAALEAAGLVLGTRTEANDQTVPEGEIISQDPAAGEEVPEESPVNVVVSAGPSVVLVPDVTCRTYATAKAELEGLGLVVQLGDPVLPLVQCPSRLNVAQQDTPPGTAVDPGTVIVVHQGLPPSPSPSPSPSP